MAIIAIVGCAYANALDGPPVFDTQSLMRLGSPIRAPWFYSIGYDGRPAVLLSFTLNHALFGEAIQGYHATNILIHVAAAILLYGVLRRTFSLLDKRNKSLKAHGRWLALSIASIWAVHPLNTQAVNYLVQRAESMMGLCYLAVLYCSIRGIVTDRAWRAMAWYAAATLCFCVGIGAKLVIVSAPLFVLLYDRCLLSGSFRNALRRNWQLYAALLPCLASMWLLGNIGHGLFHSRDFGFGAQGIRWYEYLASQAGVLLHYLRLAFWPSRLCLDYMWPLAKTWQGIVIPGIPIVAMLAGTGYALWRNAKVGLLGAWFFLILAPTSSIVPIIDLAFEHRMYLPLIGVIAGVVLLAHQCIAWIGKRAFLPKPVKSWVQTGAVVAVVIAGGTATASRNLDYQSRASLWRDTASKAPHNPRAHYNLGVAEQEVGNFTEAIAAYEEAIKIAPCLAHAHNNLGVVLRRMGRQKEAAEHFTAALRIGLVGPMPLNNLAAYYLESGDKVSALACVLESLRLEPDSIILQFKAGELLAEFGQKDRAIFHYRKVLQMYPDAAEAISNLAAILTETGQTEEAKTLFSRALALRPDSPLFRNAYGALLLRQGDTVGAIREFKAAIELAPTFADPHANLAVALFSQGDHAEADVHFLRSLELDSGAEVRLNYARSLQSRGKHHEAIAVLKKLLMREPGNTTAMYWLATSSKETGDSAGAAKYLEMAAKRLAGNAEEHYSLAKGYLNEGNMDFAVVHLALGLRLNPGSREMLLELAWILAVHPSARYRDPNAAVAYAERAKSLGPDDAIADKVLAVAYANAGRFDDAKREAKHAIAKAEDEGWKDQADMVRRLCALFEAGQPYRQTPRPRQGGK